MYFGFCVFKWPAVDINASWPINLFYVLCVLCGSIVVCWACASGASVCTVYTGSTYKRLTNRILDNGNLDTNLSISGSQIVFSFSKPCIAFIRSLFTLSMEFFSVIHALIFGWGKVTAVRFNLSFGFVCWRFCTVKTLNGRPLGEETAVQRLCIFWFIYLRSSTNVRVLFTNSYASESGSFDNNCSNNIFT